MKKCLTNRFFNIEKDLLGLYLRSHLDIFGKSD